ncbi:MAG: T9SS type A sorting domain-containing protein [Psychroflexus sp.]
MQDSFQVQTLEKIQSVQLFSITGKEVASFGAQQNYSIVSLPAGVYFVKIKSSSGENVQRIVKQ